MMQPMWDDSFGDSIVVMKPKKYLDRNHDIVDASAEMLALPSGPEKMRGSGTWATIRYARRTRVPLLICWPDGRVEE